MGLRRFLLPPQQWSFLNPQVVIYIVTIDEQFSPNGVQYRIVDMNLDGGLGDVVNNQKNTSLFQTNSEKLEVVPAANEL